MLADRMFLVLIEDSLTAGGTPPWMLEAAFWLAVAAFLAAVAATIGVWTLVARIKDLHEDGRRLEVLEEIDANLRKLVAERDDLDLRRIEHVLLDLRDTQKRLEDGIMRTIESGRAQATDTAGTSALVPAASAHSPISIGERVTNRLLAMGYERVQIITRAEKLVELASKDGEVMIEARRDGVLHKGRVLMRGGRMSDVELHPAYSIFP
jgi:hypothetical protein